MASSAALAICPFLVPLVIPIIAPVAFGFQYGAPSPDKAEIKVTPPLLSTVLAKSSISEASLIIFNWSLNH